MSDDAELEIPENADIIKLGMEADEFVRSNIGRYILGCASRDASRALNKLKIVDATDFKEIINLQGEVDRLDKIEEWLREVINTGNLAYLQYRENHELNE